jgi:hypothetical protein
MKKWVSFLLFSPLLIWSCSLPQYIWQQKDIGFFEINQTTLEKRIMIASRQSEFKSQIVQIVVNAFINQDVFIKIIGIEELKNEDANQYSAIVIINSAMGWRIDRKVRYFLARHEDVSSIIVLTTSDGGDILPVMEERKIDAISSASTKKEAEHVADIIISKINKLIKL